MHAPDDDPREPARCIACDHRRPEDHDGWLVCQHCVDRLTAALDDIRHGWPHLDPTPGSTGLDGAATNRGFGPRSPARDDVLVLTDRRRVSYDPGQPENAHALVRAVGWWADEARDAGLLDPPRRVFVASRTTVGVWDRTVPGECEALAAAAGELATVWWFGDMLAAVEAQARHVRRVLGEVDPTIPLGTCPLPPRCDVGWSVLVGDVGEVLAALVWRGERCGGEIRARALGHTATCGRCRRRWSDEAALRVLSAQLGDAWIDLPALGRYLAVSSLATLRSWAMRDDWRRIVVGRRRLYSVADARGSWWWALARRQAAAGLSVAVGRPGGVVGAAS